MVDYVALTNLRGPAARITSVTAESIPAEEPATVDMTGPDQNRQFKFKVPRGLPGVNALENDSAVAAYVAATDSDTGGAVRSVADERVDEVVHQQKRSGFETRPNIMVLGELNGAGITPRSLQSVLAQPGGIDGNNNIIGGDGGLTVRTSTPNAIWDDVDTAPDVSVSFVAGHDNVVGQISSKIISDHSYTERGVGGHVAIFGGQGHVIRSNGRFSMIAGGEINDVAGQYALATGDRNKVGVQGHGSFVAGRQNEANGFMSRVTGSLNKVDGFYSSADGSGNLVESAATFASADGGGAVARSPFQRVLAPGKNVVEGDAQTSVAAYRGVTTTAASSNLIAAQTGVGSGSQFKVAPGQTVSVAATVVGRYAGGDTAVVVDIRAVVQRAVTGNTALIGTPTVTAVYQPVPAVTATIIVHPTLHITMVQVNGAAAQEIRWAARLTTVEVIA